MILRNLFKVYLHIKGVKMADVAKSLLKVIAGLILIIVPIIGLVEDKAGLWTATWTVIKGGVVIFVLSIGLVFLLLGFSEIKG